CHQIYSFLKFVNYITHNNINNRKIQDIDRYESKKVRSEDFRDLVKSLVYDSYYLLIYECVKFL
ncbi:hypothetical protein ACO1LA_14440, partial [Staphylococcus aureus]